MTKAVLTLSNLRYQWPGSVRPVLDIAQLDIGQGSRIFLHGPSGCGKSTLLGLMAGVLIPTTGEVCLLGQPWQSLKASQRDRFRADHVGYIFQQFNLVPYLSALQNVQAPCYFSAHRKKAASREGGSPQVSAQALLQAMGLTPSDTEKPAGTLSVGQQQRVAAARALIGHPELIIADEPTSALDDATTDTFMQHLLNAAALSHSAVVFVSHNQHLARYFDRHVFLPDINQASPPETAIRADLPGLAEPPSSLPGARP